MKRDIVRKRLIAFIIDIIIVGIISSIILMGDTSRISDRSNKELTNLIDDYSSVEITTDEYLDRYSEIVYEATQDDFNQNLIYLVVSVGYFLIFQYLNYGASIGKRIMKIRIVNSSKGRVSFWQLLIRVSLVNEILAMIILLIIGKMSSGIAFLVGYGSVNLLRNLIVIVCGLTMLFNKNNVALHDKISNSKVIIDK